MIVTRKQCLTMSIGLLEKSKNTFFALVYEINSQTTSFSDEEYKQKQRPQITTHR